MTQFSGLACQANGTLEENRLGHTESEVIW
jgi:hypothetical protein